MTADREAFARALDRLDEGSDLLSNDDMETIIDQGRALLITHDTLTREVRGFHAECERLRAENKRLRGSLNAALRKLDAAYGDEDAAP